MMQRIERASTVVLALAAVVIAGVTLRREIRGADPSLQARAPTGEPLYYPEWESWLDSGISLGNPAAKATIIEFADLQCPFCARFHQNALTQVMETYSDDVALVFIHFPLMMHRFAIPAGIAAECAYQQDRFRPFVDVAFAKQDSFGVKPWAEYAREAGVAELARYNDCIDTGDSSDRLGAGRALADEIGFTGTPTVLLNGWRFPMPPSREELTRAVEEVLAGREPFDASRR